MTFGAIYCLYDDHEYLDISLEPIKRQLSKVLFLISDVPWCGKASDNSATVNKVKELCKQNPNFELIQGHWTNEADQRNFGLETFFRQSIDFAFIVDTDEIYKPLEFNLIIQFILANSQYDAFHIEWNTYWKKDYFRIVPRESFKPVIAVRCKSFLFTSMRHGDTRVIRTENAVIKTPGDYAAAIVIPSYIAICYHLSYAKDDAGIQRKLSTTSHAPEIIKGWYDNIWKKWTPLMQDLHPVSPTQYKIAAEEDFCSLPESLQVFIKKEKLPVRKCAIIILNWNSCELLKRCLELVKKHTKHPYEFIIVDNGSTKDDSVKYINNLDCKKIFNKENKGFPKAVNQAIKLIEPNNDICLLNVDAEVQENWLEEMYETMMTYSNCGMVGPLGNEVASGHQKEGYVTQDTISPNLYGFCLLILNETLKKIGFLDERYILGGFEDNDACIRAKLAGYELFISAKSLVRHKAHQVYELNGVNNLKYDALNHHLYLDKFFGMLLEYAKVYNLFEHQDFARQTGLVITRGDIEQ